jgi:hypothetical protein
LIASAYVGTRTGRTRSIASLQFTQKDEDPGNVILSEAKNPASPEGFFAEFILERSEGLRMTGKDSFIKYERVNRNEGSYTPNSYRTIASKKQEAYL